MNRRMRIKRLYSLGDYRNIEFEDEITDLPEEVLLNGDFVSKLTYLQLAGIELGYRHYMSLVQNVPHTLAVEKAIEALEEIRENTIQSLNAILNGNLEE